LGLIGVLLFLFQFLCIFSSPLAGYIADRLKIEKRIILLCSFFVASGGVITMIPSLYGFAGIPFYEKYLFLLIGIILIGLFIGPVMPLINAEVFEYLHIHRKKNLSYGTFRLHGSASWIVMNILIGAVLMVTKNISFILIFFSAGFVLLGISAMTGLRARIKPVKIPWKFLAEDKTFILFLVFCFVQSFALNTANSYLGYYFDELKMNYLVMGIAFGCGALFEVPIMFYAGVLKKLAGDKMMVILGTFLLGVRLILLAYLTNINSIWTLFFIMSLNGVGFGIQINGMMNLIDKWAHKDLRSIYMTLYTTVGICLPVAFGSLFSAYVIKHFDSPRMMLANGLIVMLGIIYFAFAVKDREKGR
jgi:MFS family permease